MILVVLSCWLVYLSLRIVQFQRYCRIYGCVDQPRVPYLFAKMLRRYQKLSWMSGYNVLVVFMNTIRCIEEKRTLIPQWAFSGYRSPHWSSSWFWRFLQIFLKSKSAGDKPENEWQEKAKLTTEFEGSANAWWIRNMWCFLWKQNSTH